MLGMMLTNTQLWWAVGIAIGAGIISSLVQDWRIRRAKARIKARLAKLREKGAQRRG